MAVFLRGPSDWSHVGRWDLAHARFEPGAWLHGRLFPRRSDLSPDGRFLCYFAHKPGASWDQGEAYVAISKLPWLTALHAFGTCGTWTRGYHFTQDGTTDADAAGLPMTYGLRATATGQFADERRRGWGETPDCPPRDPDDTWDERRNAQLHRRQPGGPRLLLVESLGWAGGEFGVGQAVDGLRTHYSLQSDRRREELDDVQWADWDREGHLLVATRDGRLQARSVRAGAVDILFDTDLSYLEPDPTPAPAWAHHW